MRKSDHILNEAIRINGLENFMSRRVLKALNEKEGFVLEMKADETRTHKGTVKYWIEDSFMNIEVDLQNIKSGKTWKESERFNMNDYSSPEKYPIQITQYIKDYGLIVPPQRKVIMCQMFLEFTSSITVLINNTKEFLDEMTNKVYITKTEKGNYKMNFLEVVGVMKELSKKDCLTGAYITSEKLLNTLKPEDQMFYFEFNPFKESFKDSINNLIDTLQ